MYVIRYGKDHNQWIPADACRWITEGNENKIVTAVVRGGGGHLENPVLGSIGANGKFSPLSYDYSGSSKQPTASQKKKARKKEIESKLYGVDK